MSDLATIALALGTAGGAWSAWPVPVPLAVALALVALVLRHAALLVVAAALLAAGLSSRAWAGLHPPGVGVFRGTVTLVGDPASDRFGLRADVRVRGKRLELRARGPVARQLELRLAGERVNVLGRLQPLPGRAREWSVPRHIAGRLTVISVNGWSAGGPVARAANRVRRTLLAGASVLPRERRPLFGGFVLGDDRGQLPEIADDFRSSGLAHLLVVSGENVAFMLALAAPLLRRLGLRARLAVGLVTVFAFGTLVRWEPSVVRAAAMAALALLASALGRPASRLRILALAVTGVVLIDPLLVHSLGFQMSVGASAAIVLVAPGIARAVPGPRPLALAFATTAAAQVGVAPVVIPHFGGLPVASLPANVLALPVAGALMMWGLGAGLPAGLLHGVLRDALHLPTRLMLAWVSGVARFSAGLPLGQLQTAHVVTIAVLGAVAWLDRGRRLRRPAIALAACVALAPAFAAVHPRPASGAVLAPGARLWRDQGAALLVIDRIAPNGSGLLAAARRSDVRRIDVLVLRSVRRTSADGLQPLARRIAVRAVLAPPGPGPPTWHRVDRASQARAGPFVLALRPAGARLDVTVRRIRSGA